MSTIDKELPDKLTSHFNEMKEFLDNLPKDDSNNVTITWDDFYAKIRHMDEKHFGERRLFIEPHKIK